MKPINHFSKYFFVALGAFLPLAGALAQSKDAADPGSSPLNPLGNTADGGPELYGRAIRLLLGFSGVAALLFFIWGGLVLLTSRGNADKIKQGRDTLVWAVIGLVVAFSSYIILRFVITSVITRES